MQDTGSRDVNVKSVADNSGGSVFSEWENKLDSLSRGLSDVISGRENKFLEISSGIQDVSSRAKQLSALSSDLANKVSGEGFGGSVNELSAKLEEMNEMSKRVDPEKGSKRLQELAGSINGLMEYMQRFRPIIRRLKVLAISTRIESARLGSEGKGFETLANDVEKLSVKTGEYSQRVWKKITELRKMVDSAKVGGGTDLGSIFEDIRSTFDNLSAMQDNSRQVTEFVTGQTEDIAGSIGEVVSSIQFHDITRQQVEHVAEILQEMVGYLKEHEANPENTEDTDVFAAWVGEVSELQASQLQAASSGFNSALGRIRDSLIDITSRIEDLEKKMQDFSRDESGQSVLLQLKNKIQGFLGHLQQGGSELEKVMQIMSSVANTVGEMGDFVREVEEVGEEMELIALNASVKAAHTGEDGLAMGVLAEDTRKLSVEAGDNTSQVAKGLEEMSSSSEELKANIRESTEFSEQNKETASRVSEIVEKLDQVNQEVSSLFIDVRERAQSLRGYLEKLAETRQLESEVTGDLERVRKDLLEIKDQAREMAPSVDKQALSDRLQDILNRYTMETERLVHKSFSGEQDEGIPEQGGGEDGGDSQEFGDNVELF